MADVLLSSISIETLKELIAEAVENKLSPLISQASTNYVDTQYLSRTDVCKILKISLPTLYSYTRDGVICGHKIGRRVLYRQIDIDTALQQLGSFKFKKSQL